MIEFAKLKSHLERTGRLKLLPQIVRELKREEARAAKLAPRIETAKENPALISGYREITEGKLVDKSGKRALLDIYQNIVA